MPRTHVTICGAPKPMAMPKIAPIHHPHDIRFAIAMPPSTITRMMATGVSQARMLVCRELAPVMNGEVCASARSGAQIIATTAAASARCASGRVASCRKFASCGMLDLRLQGAYFALAAPGGQLFSLHPTRRAEAKSLHDEVIVVSLLALSVCPIIGTNLGLENELIALARVFRDRFPETFECREPDAGNGLPRVAILVLPRIIIADQAKSRVAGIALGGEFRVFGEITHGSKSEAIHGDSLSVCCTSIEIFVAWQ